MTARTSFDVIIIGGGASGLFAANILKNSGVSFLIIEPNDILGRKLRITGKGRCNLTNDCTAEEVMKNILRNPKFLYSCLEKFPPDKIMAWFENAGVPLVTERGRRVFPASGSAKDVADALCKNIAPENVCKGRAREIITENGRVIGVKADGGRIFNSDHVILASGGRSYPRTGSDGSGYMIAEKLGHTVIKQQPSLVPIETEEKFPTVSELTLKNVTLSLYDNNKPKKPIYKELGEFNIEHYGISGPLAISASCFMDVEKITCKGYTLYIDLKPALSEQQLDSRLLREILKAPKGNIEELLSKLLPRDFIPYFSKRLRVDKTASIGNLSREERHEIIALLKRFSLIPKSLRGYDEAIITRGGISTGEIVPGSMESKLVKELYFTGEIIDCDGFTGGYNLTIAFSTAFSAAQDIIKKLKGD